MTSGLHVFGQCLGNQGCHSRCCWHQGPLERVGRVGAKLGPGSTLSDARLNILYICDIDIIQLMYVQL